MVSQTEKVLSLLVESGAIYCAIWVSLIQVHPREVNRDLISWLQVLVVACQAGVYFRNPANQCGATDCQSDYYRSFWYIFGVTMNGALVPVIVRLSRIPYFNRSKLQGVLVLTGNISDDNHCRRGTQPLAYGEWVYEGHRERLPRRLVSATTPTHCESRRLCDHSL